MSAIHPTRVALLSGSKSAAVAEVHIGVPAVRLRVQLTGLRLGERRVYSVFTTCLDKATLEYTVRFNPAQPQAFDCAAELPMLLENPAFLRLAIGPLLAKLPS